MECRTKVIVALDVPGINDVRNLVHCLGDHADMYKIGMELFYNAGPETLKLIRQAGKEVFLDLKLHDIPNTVGQGIKALMGLGASFISIHAAGGFSMMQEAARVAAETAREKKLPRPKLLAISVLTSISSDEWQKLNFSSNISEQVINLAQLAQQAGIDGVVSSPQEAAQLRRACGEKFLLVTPGIRPAGTTIDDQSRTATPSGAMNAGSNYLVIGRPITAAADPLAALLAIKQELEEASV